MSVRRPSVVLTHRTSGDATLETYAAARADVMPSIRAGPTRPGYARAYGRRARNRRSLWLGFVCAHRVGPMSARRANTTAGRVFGWLLCLDDPHHGGTCPSRHVQPRNASYVFPPTLSPSLASTALWMVTSSSCL